MGLNAEGKINQRNWTSDVICFKFNIIGELCNLWELHWFKNSEDKEFCKLGFRQPKAAKTLAGSSGDDQSASSRFSGTMKLFPDLFSVFGNLWIRFLFWFFFDIQEIFKIIFPPVKIIFTPAKIIFPPAKMIFPPAKIIFPPAKIIFTPA